MCSPLIQSPVWGSTLCGARTSYKWSHRRTAHWVTLSADCQPGWASEGLSAPMGSRMGGTPGSWQRDQAQLSDRRYRSASLDPPRAVWGLTSSHTKPACIKERRENHMSEIPVALSLCYTTGNLAEQSTGHKHFAHFPILLTFQSASRNWTDSEMKSCLDISSPAISAPWFHSKDHEQAQAGDLDFFTSQTIQGPAWTEESVNTQWSSMQGNNPRLRFQDHLIAFQSLSWNAHFKNYIPKRFS